MFICDIIFWCSGTLKPVLSLDQLGNEEQTYKQNKQKRVTQLSLQFIYKIYSLLKCICRRW